MNKIIAGLEDAIAGNVARTTTFWATQYRHVGNNGFKTRWRPLPKCGAPYPSKATREKLGMGYSLQLRGKHR